MEKQKYNPKHATKLGLSETFDLRLLPNYNYCFRFRHMKENNKSKMPWIFCVRQGGMFTS
jgi:hypothetical protein